MEAATEWKAEQAEDLLRALYVEFNRRDADAVLARMSPEVDWPNGMEGGREHGKDAVRSYWRRQWEMFDPKVEPVAMEQDAAGRTVVTVHQVVRDLQGKVLMDTTLLHVYTFRDGQVVKMEIEKGEGAHWSKPA